MTSRSERGRGCYASASLDDEAVIRTLTIHHDAAYRMTAYARPGWACKYIDL